MDQHDTQRLAAYLEGYAKGAKAPPGTPSRETMTDVAVEFCLNDAAFKIAQMDVVHRTIAHIVGGIDNRARKGDG